METVVAARQPVKVKIGMPGSIPPPASKLQEKQVVAPGVSSTPSHDSMTHAAFTMTELCSSYYLKKHVKRKVGEKSKEQEVVKKKAPRQESTAPVAKPVDNKGGSGPRVEIVNGRIVVKESSLLLNAAITAPEEEYEEVEEGVHATATYSSFLKRRPSPAWGQEETRLFYEALRQCGLQFTMMQAFFPGRTRQQLKKKYMREESLHPQLIKLALDTVLPLELAPFEAQLGELQSLLQDDLPILEADPAVEAPVAVPGGDLIEV